MKSVLYFITISCLILLLCSCSITSRKYMPGYQVEWNNKGSATHQYAAIKKNIAKPQFQYVPLVGYNNGTLSIAKPLVLVFVNKPNEHKNAIAGSCKLAVLKFVQPEVKADTGKHESNPDGLTAAKLATKSLTMAIVAVSLIALGLLFTAFFGLPEILIEAGATVLVTIVGLLGMILGLIALVGGIKAMKLMAKDPSLKEYHVKALKAIILGVVAALVGAIPIIVALVIFVYLIIYLI
jgi:hypothetical protein